jgi:lipopolysaccharide/colanic/teichoic acid biosynthesis glycosyltransferase
MFSTGCWRMAGRRGTRGLKGMGRFVKREIDIMGAIAGLALTAPAMAAAAVAILLCDGPPVFWTQDRTGLHGRVFKLWKFRTMSEARDGSGSLLEDAARLTGVGAILRAWSLDELPQLWNVLKGDMSLVGPRPLLAEYLPRYSARQLRRHEVRPGITGWAQVHGRNSLSWEEKFALDVWYVDRRSLGLDLRIAGLTLLAIACRRGISQAGHATMPEFMGSAHER